MVGLIVLLSVQKIGCCLGSILAHNFNMFVVCRVAELRIDRSPVKAEILKEEVGGLVVGTGVFGRKADGLSAERWCARRNKVPERCDKAGIKVHKRNLR